MLVVRFRLVSAEEFYALDSLTIRLYSKFINEAEREAMERMRFLAYSVLQSQSEKMIKPSDVLKFEWDDEEAVQEDRRPANEEDFERMKKMFGETI